MATTTRASSAAADRAAWSMVKKKWIQKHRDKGLRTETVHVMRLLTIGSLLLVKLSWVVFSFSVGLRHRVALTTRSLSSPLRASSVNAIREDVSPLRDGGIHKTIIKPGDPSRGKPAYGDTVTIVVERIDANGNVMNVPGLSRGDQEVTFCIGQDADVFMGFHYGVLHMALGEVARLDLEPPYAVAAAKKAVSCQVTLLSSVPPPEVDGVDEDGGVSSPGLHRHGSSDGPAETAETAETALFRRKLEENGGINAISADILKDGPHKMSRSPTFYDPARHKLDPHRQLDGSSHDHTWTETVDALEVRVPLPSSITSKKTLFVSIRKHEVWVKTPDEHGAVLFGGPLHGHIYPSESSWALEENTVSLYMRGLMAVLHLSKGHGHRDLWGSVLSRQHLAAQEERR